MSYRHRLDIMRCKGCAGNIRLLKNSAESELSETTNWANDPEWLDLPDAGNGKGHGALSSDQQIGDNGWSEYLQELAQQDEKPPQHKPSRKTRRNPKRRRELKHGQAAQSSDFTSDLDYENLVQVVDDPGLEIPVFKNPGLEVPVLKDPGLEVPVLKDPSLKGPVFKNPGLEVPVLNGPGLEVPVLKDPGLEVPALVDQNLQPSKGITLKSLLPFGGSRNVKYLSSTEAPVPSWRTKIWNWMKKKCTDKRVVALAKFAIGGTTVTVITLFGISWFKYLNTLESRLQEVDKVMHEGCSWFMEEVKVNWGRMKMEMREMIGEKFNELLDGIQQDQCEMIADNCAWDIASAVPSALVRRIARRLTPSPERIEG